LVSVEDLSEVVEVFADFEEVDDGRIIWIKQFVGKMAEYLGVRVEWLCGVLSGDYEVEREGSSVGVKRSDKKRTGRRSGKGAAMKPIFK